MKVALYSRVSTDKQSNGLESQQRALEEYCRTHNIEDYLSFSDFAVSGGKSSRPQLDKLMSEVRVGNITTVIVYSFSRFARSTKFLIDSLEEFRRLNVNFISISEAIDLSTPLGRAVFTIISALGSLERELISERVSNGLKNAKAKGRKIGRPQTVNYELVINLRNEGYSFRQISKLLKIGQGSVSTALKRSAQKVKLPDQ